MLLESIVEGIVVNEAGARSVDKVGGGLHKGNFSRTNHVHVVRGEARVDRDDVGGLEELILLDFLDARAGKCLCGDVGVVGNHFDVKTGELLGN